MVAKSVVLAYRSCFFFMSGRTCEDVFTYSKLRSGHICIISSTDVHFKIPGMLLAANSTFKVRIEVVGSLASGFPEVPKWLIVFRINGCFATFSEVLHFTFEIYSPSASSSQLQVVCKYLKFFSHRFWYWH